MRLKQKRKKPMFSVTINKKVLEAFDYCADKHSINKSNFVEKALIAWMKDVEPQVYTKLTSQLEELDFITNIIT